jgi:3'-phosphoadenosine 5'-phosphosulfate (PAPS) 3'-phosphatase
MEKIFKILKQAGQIALEEQKTLKTQVKKDGTIVTNGDLAVSHFLEKEFKILFPEYDLFCEENCSQIPQKEKVIIVDPIDGTQSYNRREDTWCILVGFTENLKPTQGFIYQPVTDKMFYASKGQGAFLQSPEGTQKLNQARTGPLKGITSFKDYGENDFFKKQGIEQVDQMFSAALKIAKIANGEYDLYPNFQKGCSIWDLVAPQILLEEAGGTLEFASPTPYQFQTPSLKERFCAYGARMTPLQW